VYIAEAVVLALGLRIPWTGREKRGNYKAMKPYIDIAEKVKAQKMAIFEKNLKG
jgi:hypothetical protein